MAQIPKILKSISPNPLIPTQMRFRGFTLIELLIVILIISIVSTTTLLTLSFNKNKQLESLANQLVNVILLAKEDALLRSATLGLNITDHSYQFYIFTKKNDQAESHWEPLTDSLFGRHKISKDISLSLSLPSGQERYKNEPQLIISASGDISPFKLYIAKLGESPHYVISQIQGRVTYALYKDNDSL